MKANLPVGAIFDYTAENRFGKSNLLTFSKNIFIEESSNLNDISQSDNVGTNKREIGKQIK